MVTALPVKGRGVKLLCASNRLQFCSGNEMEVCLSPLLTAIFQFEQQENTIFFHKPVKPAAQTPVTQFTEMTPFQNLLCTTGITKSKKSSIINVVGV